MRFVVLDMGNGVDRLLDSELITISAAFKQARIHGSFSIDCPPPRFFDLATEALVNMGFDRREITHMTAYARAIDERTTEIVVWYPQ